MIPFWLSILTSYQNPNRLDPYRRRMASGILEVDMRDDLLLNSRDLGATSGGPAQEEHQGSDRRAPSLRPRLVAPMR